MYKVGFSSEIISPKEPVWMGGYAARNKKSCGIHDDIYAKASYISDGNTEIVLVSCDMLYLMQENVEHIRKKAYARYGIKNVTIGATHDHSSPEIHIYDGQTDMDTNLNWLKHVEDIAVEIIGEAIQSAEPMKLYAGFLPAQGVAKNRRIGETAVDDTLMAIRAVDMQGQTKGFIINYSCHCTVLDSKNYFISADYPCYIYRKLNERYKQATALFFNGSCGNINIGYSADASALGEDMGDVRTFENAERKADILFDKIEQIMMQATELKPYLVYRTLDLDFPLKANMPSAETLEKQLEKLNIDKCSNQTDKEKLEIQRIYCYYLLDNIRTYHTEGAGTIRGESVLIGLDDVLLITLPVELFCEIGIKLKEIFKDRWRAAILGYTNGFYGYLPTRAAHLAGGYECETSIHSIDSEDYLTCMMKKACTEI